MQLYDDDGGDESGDIAGDDGVLISGGRTIVGTDDYTV